MQFRLGTAFLLTLLIHTFILGIGVESLKGRKGEIEIPKKLSFSLHQVQPKKKAPPPALKEKSVAAKQFESVPQKKIVPAKKIHSPKQPVSATETPIKQETVIDRALPEPAPVHNKSLQTEERETTQKTLTKVLVIPPQYSRNPAPPYPRIARKRRLQGTVMLQVLVDADGNPSEIKPISSSGHGILDKAALTAVQKWTFSPGTRDGENVEMWVQVPVRFHLR
ncbi:MAG: energy transducer TonB [Desulfobulbaceae bacterium]|nr:energy transducer TonB [Desulfobulbaceae bacterium]